MEYELWFFRDGTEQEGTQVLPPGTTEDGAVKAAKEAMRYAEGRSFDEIEIKSFPEDGTGPFVITNIYKGR